ncbi:copper amine oxidase [Herbiconiux ginsengi]|uniref:copper amine oxidase n=1 Tax=Herbiconiux ginsengi TaxID=381665 RepID=UPI000A8BFF4E|nr:LPXTG cell wall anchor domain-containing protein [Herbiconiux ginsengi]
MQKIIRTVALAAAALTVGSALALVPTSAATAAPPVSCSGEALVEKTFDNGTAWQMCWRVDSKKGLTLEQVNVKAPGEDSYRRVLESAYLSQLHVPYDTGKNVWNDITSYGFGNQYLQKLSSAECTTGALKDVAQSWTSTREGVTTTRMRTIPALCVTDTSRDLAYRSHEQSWGSIDDKPLFASSGQGFSLQIVSKVDWYEYATKVEFTDEGAITFDLGATGDVSYEDMDADSTTGWPIGEGQTAYAASHWHNAIWRLDFGLDGQGNQAVEQYDSGLGEQGTRVKLMHTSPKTISNPANLAPVNDLTWWRVVAPDSLNADGHARSYEFVFPGSQLYQGDPVTQPLLTFTNYNACQEYATSNLNPACADRNVIQYVASSADQALTDPVAWVNSGFHHVVRDEDQSPMQTHWQSFSIMPRDWTSQSMSTPDGRSCINGDPGGEIHTDESPCEVVGPEPEPEPSTEPTVEPSPSAEPSSPPAGGGEGATLALGSTKLIRGESFTLSGGGFAAGEDVAVTLHSDPISVGTLKADGVGELSGTLTLPATAPLGAHTLRAVGSDSGRSAEAAVTVSGASGAGALANTGGTIVGGSILGGILLLVVGALLLVKRRRAAVHA